MQAEILQTYGEQAPARFGQVTVTLTQALQFESSGMCPAPPEARQDPVDRARRLLGALAGAGVPLQLAHQAFMNQYQAG